MKQYLELLQKIKSEGVQKEQARDGMPTTQSLFGYQTRFNLHEGFPIVTTKFVPLGQVVKELLWILRGQTNVIELVKQKANFWNEDSYSYYSKVVNTLITNRDSFVNESGEVFTFQEYMENIHKIIKGESDQSTVGFSNIYGPYHLGDCGYQYGATWRGDGLEGSKDQIASVLCSLRDQPFGRRHIVSAIDPDNDTKLALYWCHALFQFNVRPATRKNTLSNHWHLIDSGKAKFLLDCEMYQRSMDVPLGGPFNISSYSLLIHIFSKLLNMIPGDYIHTVGDAHIYSNQMDQVNLQLTREPFELPELEINTQKWYFPTDFSSEEVTKCFHSIQPSDFTLINYKFHEKIEIKLSTGIKK